MKQTLTVDANGYDIIISNDEFSKLVEDLNAFTYGQKRLIVISKKVYGLYKTKLNLNPDELFILNDGEREKNFKNYIKILQKAAELGLTRSDIIIAIGGGVVFKKLF